MAWNSLQSDIFPLELNSEDDVSSSQFPILRKDSQHFSKFIVSIKNQLTFPCTWSAGYSVISDNSREAMSSITEVLCNLCFIVFFEPGSSGKKSRLIDFLEGNYKGFSQLSALPSLQV